ARDLAKQEQADRQRQGKLDEGAGNPAPLNQQPPKARNRPPGADAPPPPRPPPAKQGTLPPGHPTAATPKRGVSYTGTLVSMTGERVKLQTIPDPQARPSDFDIRDVQAFQTRDGVFAYNEGTGSFESALTFYKLNKSGDFERMEATQDTYLSED